MSDCASQGLSQVSQDFVTDGILSAALFEVPFRSRSISLAPMRAWRISVKTVTNLGLNITLKPLINLVSPYLTANGGVLVLVPVTLCKRCVS